MKRLAAFLILFIFFFLPQKALAVCPVCTVAVAAGVGLSRFIGIDDTVSGVWVGGLIVSSGLWLSSFLEKRNKKFPFMQIVSVALFYILVIPPLYFGKVIGHSSNQLFGVDKLVLGTIAGSLIFLLSGRFDAFLRSTNEGKVYVAFQRVILPVSLLIIASFVFVLVT